jgi:hypothetical protein
MKQIIEVDKNNPTLCGLNPRCPYLKGKREFYCIYFRMERYDRCLPNRKRCDDCRDLIRE